jgi:hypothetical protein
MSEKIQTKTTLEGGVNHLQPSAPSGFSLSRVQKEDGTLDIKSATKILSKILAFKMDTKDLANALYDARKRKNGYSFTFRASKITWSGFILRDEKKFQIEFISFFRTLENDDLLITIWISEVE